jgi:hypothetical protein
MVLSKYYLGIVNRNISPLHPGWRGGINIFVPALLLMERKYLDKLKKLSIF